MDALEFPEYDNSGYAFVSFSGSGTYTSDNTNAVSGDYVPGGAITYSPDNVRFGNLVINNLPEQAWGFPVQAEARHTDWRCTYCGKVNAGDQRACGAGEWDGCGAPVPEQEELRHTASGRSSFIGGGANNTININMTAPGKTAGAFDELGIAWRNFGGEISRAFGGAR